MTEQHAETEEPCDFKFCVMITHLPCVFLTIRISRRLMNHLKWQWVNAREHFFSSGWVRQHLATEITMLIFMEHGMHMHVPWWIRTRSDLVVSKVAVGWRWHPPDLGGNAGLCNPELYPGIYLAVKTLLTYPVSTCVAEQSFSSTKRLKTPLRSTMSDARLTSLSVIHINIRK